MIQTIDGNTSLSANTIVVPDDYEKIQEAIDNARKGDTIFIKSGIYYENLIIEISIKLIGEDKNSTIIDGSQNGSVIKILKDFVFINDLTIQNSSKDTNGFSAIESYSADNYFVRNNIKDNMDGINLKDGDNNTIMYNHFTNNQNEAIYINSPYNTIYKNNIIGNNAGVYLNINATNNLIKQNNFIENRRQAYFDSNLLDLNLWSGNYWDNCIPLFPKPIIGRINFGSIIWIKFDWNPATEPYDISC